jgi:predicted transcriptional regulator
LVVVDDNNRVKGMVTRKDVLPYKLQEAAGIASSFTAGTPVSARASASHQH